MNKQLCVISCFNVILKISYGQSFVLVLISFDFFFFLIMFIQWSVGKNDYADCWCPGDKNLHQDISTTLLINSG